MRNDRRHSETFCPEAAVGKEAVQLIDEGASRRTIAVSVRASEPTARGLAYMLGAVGRKIRKAYWEHRVPHGRQSVKKLMGYGVATGGIELSGDTRVLDWVARKWNVDYALYRTGLDKYLLSFKSGQADAITACFSEYSWKVLNRSKSRRIPIWERLKQVANQFAKEKSRKWEWIKEAVREDR